MVILCAFLRCLVFLAQTARAFVEQESATYANVTRDVQAVFAFGVQN